MRNQDQNTPAGDVDMPTEVAGEATDEATRTDLLRSDDNAEAALGPAPGPALQSEPGATMTEDDFEVPGPMYRLDEADAGAADET